MGIVAALAMAAGNVQALGEAIKLSFADSITADASRSRALRRGLCQDARA
jgi:hypothetical protein